MTQQGTEPNDGDQQRPQEPTGPVAPPGDWYAADVGTVPPAGATSPAPHPGSHGEQMPTVEGVTFTRATEYNSRAIIAMVLSGLGLAGVLAWFAGFATPLLLVIALGIVGIVMGLRGRAAARNGLAANGGLGLAAAITGLLALLGALAIFALVVIAVSQLTG